MAVVSGVPGYVDRVKKLQIPVTRRQLNYAAVPLVLIAIIVVFGVGSGKTFSYSAVQSCLASSGQFEISQTSFQSVNQAGFETIELASTDQQGRQITASVVVARSVGEAKHVVDIANVGLAYGNSSNRTRRYHNVVVSFDRDAPSILWTAVANCLHG